MRSTGTRPGGDGLFVWRVLVQYQGSTEVNSAGANKKVGVPADR
ncbi:MAG: hypothetical protein ACKVP0_24600 [Pirellulaceae bacterium]